MPRTRGAGGPEKALPGHSTNRANVIRNAALISYSWRSWTAVAGPVVAFVVNGRHKQISMTISVAVRSFRFMLRLLLPGGISSDIVVVRFKNAWRAASLDFLRAG